MPSPDQDALMSCVERGGGRGRFSLAPTAIRRVNTPHPQRNPALHPAHASPSACGTWVAGSGLRFRRESPEIESAVSRSCLPPSGSARSGRGRVARQSSLTAQRPAARRARVFPDRIGRHRMIALRFSVVSAFSPRGNGNDNETRSLVPRLRAPAGPRACHAALPTSVVRGRSDRM